MSEKPVLTPSRYSTQDEYIQMEIRHRFTYGTRNERIELLKEVYEAGDLPYEIARVVVECPDPVVRHWLARNARSLDFREKMPEDLRQRRKRKRNKQPLLYKYPDRNLWEGLESDEEPYIRAALHENEDYMESLLSKLTTMIPGLC